jgi:UDP-glucose:(heptosyl)LPS alpha-1,3-glucosyltransferase
VPGDPQRAFLVDVAPEVSDRTFLMFPNLIDEKVFVGRVALERQNKAKSRAALGVSADKQLWVCPARLETFKGVDRLLTALEGVQGVELLVAGTGSLRASLERRIAERRLPARLLGQVDQDAMVRLYAAADVFVLPSLQDPSPLSAIEACAAGLPLVVSRAIGNLADVTDGENGWVFDPLSAQALWRTLREVAACSADALAGRGKRSSQLYHERFRTEHCVASLASGLRALFERRRVAGRPDPESEKHG